VICAEQHPPVIVGNRIFSNEALVAQMVGQLGFEFYTYNSADLVMQAPIATCYLVLSTKYLLYYIHCYHQKSRVTQARPAGKVSIAVLRLFAGLDELAGPEGKSPNFRPSSPHEKLIWGLFAQNSSGLKIFRPILPGVRGPHRNNLRPDPRLRPLQNKNLPESTSGFPQTFSRLPPGFTRTRLSDRQPANHMSVTCHVTA